MQATDEAKAFLLANTPDKQRELCHDAEDCHFGAHPTLAEVSRAYGANTAQAWLLPQLFNLSEYCGAKDKLTQGQYKDLAFIIATDFYYLKTSELMLFFYRFKAGCYGHFYGTVDPMMITTALRLFIKERSAAIDRHENELAQKRREEARQQSCTWEEYCKMKGIEKASPLEGLLNQNIEQDGN